MPQARDEAGNIWEVDGQGNAIRLITPAPQQRGPITIGTPDPTTQYAVPQAAAQTTKAQADAQSATAQAPYAGTVASAGASKAQSEAELAALKAEEARREAEKEDSPLAMARKELQTDSVIARIGKARQQISDGWSTGNLAGSKGFQGVPFVGQSSANLAATLEGLKGGVINDMLAELKALSPTGSSGYGSFTETEANRLAASIAAISQTQDSKSLLEELARLERHYRNGKAILNGHDPRLEEVQEQYGIIPETSGDNAQPIGGDLTSEGRSEADPALRGVNSKVASMIKAGRSEQEVKDYLNAVSPGLGDRANNIDWWTNFIAQNPNETPSVDLESVWQPSGGISQTLGDIGMSPVGAGLIGAADTATLGFLDNMTGNPDMTRAVMAGVEQENPGSYLTGQVLGGVTTGLGIEAGLARGGLTGLRGARAGDAVFGAGYGAGLADDPDDSRVVNALLGAGAGVAGGAAGRGAARVAGRAMEGVTSKAQNILNDAGVQMTPGQVLGGGVKAVEDRLAGLPLIGDTITRRRQEGLESFNRAAFDEGLAPIGASTQGVTGAPGIDAARIARSSAYDDALSGVNLRADDVFVQDIERALIQADRLPEPMRSNAMTSLELRIGNTFGDQGDITGKGYQQVLRGLRRDAKSVESLPFGYDAAEISRAGQDAMQGIASRQAPEVIPALQSANAANMNVETLRSAVDKAKNTGEVFTPAQLSMASAQSARRFGNNQGTTNQPFYELSRAGQEVLPNKIPDSGTAGRLVLPMLAAGTVGGGTYAGSDGEALERSTTGATSAVIAGLLAAAPYSQAARGSLQKLMLTPRPEVMRQLGIKTLDNSEIAGLLAAPATVGYIAQ